MTSIPPSSSSFAQLFCERPGHQRMVLNTVCRSRACSDRGLLCSLCISSSNHGSHDLQMLPEFLNSYRQSESNWAISEHAQIIFDLRTYFKTLEQTLVNIIRESEQRILSGLEGSSRELKEAIHYQQSTQILIPSQFASNQAARVSILNILEQTDETTFILRKILEKSNSIKKQVKQDSHVIASSLLEALKQITQPSINLSENTPSLDTREGFFQSAMRQNPQSSNLGSASGSRIQQRQQGSASPFRTPLKSTIHSNNHSTIDRSPSRTHLTNSIVDPYYDDTRALNNNRAPAQPSSILRESSNKSLLQTPSTPPFNAGRSQSKDRTSATRLKLNKSGVLLNNFTFNDREGGIITSASPSFNNNIHQSINQGFYEQRSDNLQIISPPFSETSMSHQLGAGITVVQQIDVNFIATGSVDSTIRIWERFNKRLIVTLTGHINGVTALGYSSTTRVLASGGEDDGIILWKPSPTWRRAFELQKLDGRIVQLIFVSERELISVSNRGLIVVWDVERGEAKRSVGGTTSSNQVSSACLYDKTLICADRQFVIFWEFSSLSILKKAQAHREVIVGIKAFTRRRMMNRRYIATASRDGEIIIWDAEKQFVESQRISAGEQQLITTNNIQTTLLDFDFCDEVDSIVYIIERDRQVGVRVFHLASKKIIEKNDLSEAISVMQVKVIGRTIYLATFSHSLIARDIQFINVDA